MERAQGVTVFPDYLLLWALCPYTELEQARQVNPAYVGIRATHSGRTPYVTPEMVLHDWPLPYWPQCTSKYNAAVDVQFRYPRSPPCRKGYDVRYIT